MAEEVRRLAVGEGEQPDDTALLFRRDEAGRQCRQRAADGSMPPAGVACLPPCFRGLLEHLRSPINRATGERIKSADYVNMIDEDGQPRLFTRTIVRRKLGKIAKGTIAKLLVCRGTGRTYTPRCRTSGLTGLSNWLPSFSILRWRRTAGTSISFTTFRPPTAIAGRSISEGCDVCGL